MRLIPILILTLILSGCATHSVVTSPKDQTLTVADLRMLKAYGELHQGMTKEDLDRLFGSSGMTVLDENHQNGVISYTWESEKRIVLGTFQNDKIISAKKGTITRK